MAILPKIPDPTEKTPLTGRQVGWLSVAMAAAVLAFLPYLPAWAPLLALFAIGWRALAALHRLPLPSRPLLIVLTLAAVALVLGRYGSLLGRDPGSGLLVLMAGLKILESRSRRDGAMSGFLGFFLVATLFFHSQEIPVALYAIGSVWLFVSALLALQDGDTREGPRMRLSATLLAQSLPIMLVLFFLFPRLPGALWGGSASGDTGVTGLSETMEPGSISELLTSGRTAFRVTFEDAPPPPALRYWRGPVLSRYDGRVWRPVRMPAGAAGPPIEAGATTVSYSLRLEPSSSRWLPALDLPLFAPPGTVMMRDLEIALMAPPHTATDHRLQSATDYRLEAQLSAERRALYLRLPDGSAPRARALARQWRAETGGATEALVTAALALFRDQPFFYTLSPPRLQDDPVDGFLFETRRGFCEHYASSFTVLMRAAGIPARVVTGYQGGEWNPAGGYLLVRQSDAHAWAAVWIEGRGWVRIDPTAAVSPERVAQGIASALATDIDIPVFLRRDGLARLRWQASLAWDSIDYHWQTWVLAFGPERQRELLAGLGLRSADFGAMVAIMVAMTGALLAAFAAWAGWKGRQSPRDPASIAFERLSGKLAAIGLARQRSEGPLDYARRVRSKRPDIAPEFERLAMLYAALRYEADPPPDSLRALREGVRRFCANA